MRSASESLSCGDGIDGRTSDTQDGRSRQEDGAVPGAAPAGILSGRRDGGEGQAHTRVLPAARSAPLPHRRG
jgi:hypothetical protein